MPGNGNYEYQPRYVAYASAHDATPGEMLARDVERWPGGRMAGYAIWVSQKWREWDAARGQGSDHVRGDEEHAAFAAWLLGGCK